MKNAAMWVVVGVVVLGAGLAAVWVLNSGSGNPASAESPIEGAPPSSGVGQAPSGTVVAENPGETPADTAPAAEESEEAQGDVVSTSSAETTLAQQDVTSAVVQVPASDLSLELRPMAIEELIESGESYEGREVLVKGTIITQCMRGCKFAIDDGTGVINVELVAKALDRLISQGSVGKQAQARGVFHQTPRPLVAVEKPENWDFLK